MVETPRMKCLGEWLTRLAERFLDDRESPYHVD